MARIIDRGIGNGDKYYVTIMCLLMVSLGIIGLVCSATAQYFAAKAAVGFSTKLRHALFFPISRGPFFYRNGYHGYLHSDHQDDK